MKFYIGLTIFVLSFCFSSKFESQKNVFQEKKYFQEKKIQSTYLKNFGKTFTLQK